MTKETIFFVSMSAQPVAQRMLAGTSRLLYDHLAGEDASESYKVGRAGPAQGSERGGAMAQDPTLIQIRERSYLDLLDLSLLVVRSRPRTLALAAMAGIAPFAILNVWVLSDPDVPRWIWPLLLFFEAPWATAPLTLVLGGLMFGQPPGPGAILGRILRASPRLILVQV